MLFGGNLHMLGKRRRKRFPNPIDIAGQLFGNVFSKRLWRCATAGGIQK